MAFVNDSVIDSETNIEITIMEEEHCIRCFVYVPYPTDYFAGHHAHFDPSARKQWKHPRVIQLVTSATRRLLTTQWPTGLTRHKPIVMGFAWDIYRGQTDSVVFWHMYDGESRFSGELYNDLQHALDTLDEMHQRATDDLLLVEVNEEE